MLKERKEEAGQLDFHRGRKEKKTCTEETGRRSRRGLDRFRRASPTGVDSERKVRRALDRSLKVEETQGDWSR